MRKLLIILLSALSLTVFAQSTKKVAVLKVVDRQNELSSDLKFILRSNIERAITNTSGYEAYTRGDIDVVLDEHNFQRSGLVKDDEIRMLGRMTGVSLILVTEAILTSNNGLYVTVKLIDVVTGRNIKTEDSPMGRDIESIRLGCAKLANLLLGTVNVYDSRIFYLGHNEYSYQGRIMNNKEYELFLRNNCQYAYQQYRKGKVTIDIGWGCLGGGASSLLMGGIMFGCRNLSNDDGQLMEAGITFMVLGAISMIVGTTVLCMGYPTRNRALEVYNQNCASSPSQKRYTLKIGTSPNGVGIAMNF